jgi:hypothetical protein
MTPVQALLFLHLPIFIKLKNPAFAAMQVYNTAERWLHEDSTNNEMGMHAIILL